MSLDALPPEINGLIFVALNNSFHPKYNRRDVLNAMLTCKKLHSVGLPYLYTDVILQNVEKAFSFFIRLPDLGHFVRRLRIEEECDVYKKRQNGFYVHRHIIAPDRLHAVARYCCNLKVLFIGWSCLQTPTHVAENMNDGLDSWMERFVDQRPTLEALVIQSGFSAVAPPYSSHRNRGPGPHEVDVALLAHLNSLRELRFDGNSSFDADIGLQHLTGIARSCPEIREVYFREFGPIVITSFLDFLKHLANLRTLHVVGQLFVSPNRDEDDSVNIAKLLKELPRYNRNLRTLVLRCMFLPRQFPEITTDSYPHLRVVDLSRTRWMSTILELRKQNESIIDFLGNLPALEVVHLDQTYTEFDGRIFDILPRTVQVHTILSEETEPGKFSNEILQGRLVDKLGMSSMAGLEEDRFMLHWHRPVENYYEEEEDDDDDEEEEEEEEDELYYEYLGGWGDSDDMV
jgi:hypothetical protein